MSIDATRFVWKLSKNLISSSQKLFLLSVADRCGENNECYPSLARLESDTGLNRKTLIECRKHCIEIGILSYTGKFAPKKSKSNEKDKPQEYTQVPVMRLNCNVLREFEAPIDKIVTRTKNGTSTVFGTGTSTKNGTGTSTVFGTLNLSVEPISRTVCTEPLPERPISHFPIFEDYKKNEVNHLHEANNNFMLIQAKEESLKDEACLSLFQKKFGEYDVDFEKLYDLAQEKCGKPYKPVGKNGFYNFLNTQKNYFYTKKTKSIEKRDVILGGLTQPERELLQEYQHASKYPNVIIMSDSDKKEAQKLLHRVKIMKDTWVNEGSMNICARSI